MRTLLKFATLAAGMALLLATAQWVRIGPAPQQWDYWGHIYEPLGWVIVTNQLVSSIVIIVTLARERRQRGRTLGMILAAGLLATGLLGTGVEDLMITAGHSEMDPRILSPDQGACADLLTFCFALGLVVVLAVTRRWKSLWLGLGVLAGGLMLVTRLVWLAQSFM